MYFVYSKKFRKMFEKCPSSIQGKCLERLLVLQENRHDSLLRSHKLTGKYIGFQSINITGDWRVVYKENGDEIVLSTIGTHSQLYK